MTSTIQVAHEPDRAWAPPEGWGVQAVLEVSSPDQTDRFAVALADATGAGDTILLSGDLGSGKTHLARAFIRHALGPNGAGAEVPSPSFTLVQTYETGVDEIWHADLYRLGDASEMVELGLDLAMEEARCLIEWPERMAPEWPPRAVLLRIEPTPSMGEDARRLSLHAPDGSALGHRLVPLFASDGTGS